MKGWMFIIFLIFLLSGCMVYETQGHAIDQEVFNELREKEHVRVIITLEVTDSQIQNDIISLFSKEEFNLTNQGSGWFAGIITAEGLNKIKADARIKRVYLPRPKEIQND